MPGTGRKRLSMLAAVLAASGAAGSAAQDSGSTRPRYRVTELSVPEGATLIRPRALNDRGQVVGDWLCEVPGTPPRHFSFLWERGKVQDLGPLDAWDINNRGQVAGRWEAEAGRPEAEWAFPAALWQNGKRSLLDVFSLQRQNSTGFALNERGQVVGIAYQEKPYARREFMWEKGRSRELVWTPREGKPAEHPTGSWLMHPGSNILNERGEVAGCVQTEVKDGFGYPIVHAAVWRNGQVAVLGSLAGYPHSRAAALNDRGVVVGEAHPPRPPYPHARAHFLRRAVLWENGKARDLGLLPDGDLSEAHAVNNRGEVVGKASSPRRNASGTPWDHAVVWRESGILDLNDALPAGSKTMLLNAVDINERGQILCDGLTHGEGRRRAFLLSPQD